MDPIVVAKAVSSHDPSHAVVKIRGVDATGLELRLQSWQDSDAGRLPETAGYLAFERGRHSLGDGIMVEAGSVEVSRQHALVSMNFTAPFRTTPVVLTAVSSALHDKGPSGRPTRITKPGFQFHHPSRAAEEASEGTDVISYIAWVPAAGTIEGLAFEVGRTDRVG